MTQVQREKHAGAWLCRVLGRVIQIEIIPTPSPGC